METVMVAAVTSAVVKMVLQKEKCKHKQYSAAWGFGRLGFSCTNMPYSCETEIRML